MAQLACLGRFETCLHDPDPVALRAGGTMLREALSRGAERGRWSAEEAEGAAARLVETPDLSGLAGCDLVIEAAPEDLALKRGLLAGLAELCGPDAILATNTSSLSVTAIAAGIERPERVCGMHFFNPPAAMRLVEVVAADQTSGDTLAAVDDVARAMGREPIRAADRIGFVANRVARPFTLEALRLLGQGVASHEQIDRIARLGGGFRMGPFELMDLIGVDVNLDVAKSFWEQSFHEPRWQPHPIQARMVAAGRVGRKSGRGYYEYGDGPHRPDDPPPIEARSAAAGADPAPASIEGAGFRAVCVERASPAELDPSGAAVGYVALPTLAEARLVEIVAGPATSPEALDAAERHFAELGKHVERVGAAVPGLVLGRIVCQIVNEASFAVGEGVATRSDADTAMRLGFNWPRGPFDWAEAIGAGRVVGCLDALRAELGEERYRVAPALRAQRLPLPETGRSIIP
ncbi:MAG: 3-hydroxyacyl-CoA dehydrogenase NAD-binding domain-containing protein [Solirubrobacterales bacterium]